MNKMPKVPKVTKMPKVTKTEALEREDSIWLSLKMGKAETHQVMYWEDAVACNGDFGNIDEVIVYGIPLYGDEPIEAATRYILNQTEIHDLQKANKKLLNRIGNTENTYEGL